MRKAYDTIINKAIGIRWNMEKDLFGFDTNGMTDDEIGELLDSISLEIAKRIDEDEGRASIANPFRIKQLNFTAEVMRKLAKQSKAKVSCLYNEPFTGMGSVSITGKEVIVKNMPWFLKAAEFASNFEVYPKTDGTICMTFTFHNLTQPIE